MTSVAMNEILNITKQVYSFFKDEEKAIKTMASEHLKQVLKSKNAEYLIDFIDLEENEIDNHIKTKIERSLSYFRDLKMFDFLGHLYEKFLERNHKDDYGVFYTKKEVVKYILSVSDYKGEKIIDKKVFEPSCGSGRFLIISIREYKKALKNKIKDNLEYSIKLLNDVENNFYGLDLDKNAVYITKINLFLELVDDLKLLYENSILKKVSFNIVNRDFFDYVLDLKLKFDYIFANPPYVTERRTEREFRKKIERVMYKVIGSNLAYGDLNLWTSFLAISSYFLEKNGTLGFIIPNNILCDFQTEKVRRYLETIGKVKNITTFINIRNILFDKVEQPVLVFVFRKTKENIPIEITYGYSENKDVDEMIKSAFENKILVDNISLHDKKANFLYWVSILHKNKTKAKELYENVERIYSDNEKFTTFKNFLQSMNVDISKFSEGDFRINLLKENHYSKDYKYALPLYGGKDIRPFYKLPETPRPIKNRSPYVGYIENKKDFINRKLKKLYEINSEKYLVLFHRIPIGLNYPRSIRGLVEVRGPQRKFVMSDSISFIETDSIDKARKIALLMFSLPFNFFYNITTSNIHVAKGNIIYYRVPRDISLDIEKYDKLFNIFKQFKEKFEIEDITEYLNSLWYDLKEKYTIEKFVNWKILIRDVDKITLSEFLEKNTKRNSFSGFLPIKAIENIAEFKTEADRKVFSIFASEFKDKTYSEAKEVFIPSNSDLFLEHYEKTKNDFINLLKAFTNTIRENDYEVFEYYGFKNIELLDLVMVRIK